MVDPSWASVEAYGEGEMRDTAGDIEFLEREREMDTLRTRAEAAEKERDELQIRWEGQVDLNDGLMAERREYKAYAEGLQGGADSLRAKYDELLAGHKKLGWWKGLFAVELDQLESEIDDKIHELRDWVEEGEMIIHRPELKDAVIHGYGVLGKSTARAFNIKHWQDPNGGNTTLEASAEYRFHFVCVPTLFDWLFTGYDNRAIADIICAVMTHSDRDVIFIIRSTILPGTCRYLMKNFGASAIVHVPEFLTESNWEHDTDFPDQIIVGADDVKTRDGVLQLYRKYYSYNQCSSVFATDTVTAELIKCAHNAFFSTKVIFANEIYEMAKKAGADYDTIRDALYRSKWIGGNHLDVNFQRPSWDKPRRGLHGKCLPKDLKALLSWSNSDLLEVVDLLNERYREGGK